MATKSQKVKLGIFLTATGLLFIGTLAVFAGLRLFDTKHEYHILFSESVSGLELGSPVKLKGVRVGNVARIRVNPENVEQIKVTVDIEPGTPIKKDMAAVLMMQGITGLKYIELVGGSKAAEPLPPDSIIPEGESLVAKFSDRADEMTDKADRILDNLLDITGEENQANLAATMTHIASMAKTIDTMAVSLEAIIREIEAILQENRDPMRNTIANVDRATRRVEEVVANSNSLITELNAAVEGVRLKETIAGIDQTNRMIQAQFAEADIQGTIDDVTVTLNSMQLVLEQLTRMMGQNQDQLRATMYNLRLATESIKEFSRQVQQRPSSLIFDRQPEERKLP